MAGEGATRTWSGLMTDSKDALPVVGEVPGKEGMYLSAEFHGHGQVSSVNQMNKRDDRADHRVVWSVANIYHRQGSRRKHAPYRRMASESAYLVHAYSGTTREKSTREAGYGCVHRDERGGGNGCQGSG
jgi:hypothetical protein